MATYYVDGRNGNDTSGTGTSTNPWKSLKTAHSRISAGDTVRVRTATYREVVTITKENTTWVADEGHQPVIDGGYNESLFSDGVLPGPEPYLPGANHSAMVNFRADNVTFDGITVQNVAGRAFSLSRHQGTVRNCRVDFTYGSGIIITAGTDGVRPNRCLVENCVITRTVFHFFHPESLGSGVGPDAGGASMAFVQSDNTIIRYNIIGYGCGEGIDLDRGSDNGLVEGNVVHTHRHVHIYFQRCKNSIARNNFIYHLGIAPYLGGGGKLPHGMAIGDETASSRFGTSYGNSIYNNIVVGCGAAFSVRNNSTNYDTQLKQTYIGYNTFVATEGTLRSVLFVENQRGRPHQTSLFENNIIYQNGYGAVGVANGSLSGITFRNNVWSEPPPPALRGQGDAIGDPRLENPQAAIVGTAPNSTNADPFNYKLTANSNLAIGKASDGTPISGFRPPEVARDFFNRVRDGAADVGAHEITGVIPPLTANFSVGPDQTSGLVPHTVDFVDKSTSDSPITSWLWDFGDGTRSTVTNPSHTYMEPGSFDVSLTVQNEAGGSDTLVMTELISVLPDDPPPYGIGDFRRFLLVRQSSNEVLAYGTQYPDQTCVMLWNSEPFHVLNYNDIRDVAAAHEKPGENQLMWLDPEQEPVGAEE